MKSHPLRPWSLAHRPSAGDPLRFTTCAAMFIVATDDGACAPSARRAGNFQAEGAGHSAERTWKCSGCSARAHSARRCRPGLPAPVMPAKSFENEY